MEPLCMLFEACLNATYTHVENGGSYAVVRDGEHLFLFFEHSNGITDWWNNLQFAAKLNEEMEPPLRCHEGFMKVWKSVKPYLVPHIMDKSVASVCVVGYSHGAALALLCHEHIYRNRPELRKRLMGFGYGCPRVLFECPPVEVAERWEQFYVIRNVDDIVTHLPPRSLGYCHVGNMILIGEEGKYSPVDAHRPENYRRELCNTTGQENIQR